MKSRNLLLLAFLLLLSLGLEANDFVSERVFVYPVKSHYLIGDSVEVKGQVLSEDSTFVPHSRYLWLDVIRGTTVIYRQYLRCDASGSFYTRFHVAPTWKADIYHIRAYTRFMQNYSSKSFPMVPLQIGGEAMKQESGTDGVFCEFYPEGGKLLADQLQNVTVALKDAGGKPLSIPYCIASETDTLMKQTTTASGLQIVRMSFQSGKSYFLHCRMDGKLYTFPFPEYQEGAGLQTFVNGVRVTYRVLGASPSMRLYAFHPGWGIRELGLKETGILDLRGLEAGMLTLFLMDGKNEVVSERSVWVEKTSVFRPRLLGATIGKDEKLSLQWSSELPEESVVHVRLLKKDDWPISYAERSLKWCNGMISSLDFPVNYFTESEDEQRTDLQAWLQSITFARFNLKQVLTDGFSFPHYVEQVMALKGSVTDQLERTIDKGEMTAYHEKTARFYQAEVDKKGNFYIPVDDFANGDEFYLLANYTGTRPGVTEYRYAFLDEVIPEVPAPKASTVTGWYIVQDSLGKKSGSYGVDKNNLLPEIHVGAKSLKVKHESTEKYYGNNYFDADRIREKSYSDMLQVLSQMPALVVVKNPDYIDMSKRTITTSEYKIETVRGSLFTFTGSKKSRLTIVLDGNKVEADEIIHLNIHDVALVQYLKPHEALREKGVFHAIDGALVIKTKNARDAALSFDDKKRGIYCTPLGLSNYDIPFQSSLSHSKDSLSGGEYRLVVDLVSKEGIRSFEIPMHME